MANEHPLNPKVKDTARRLRRDSTFPERLLWSKLRANQIDGLKFRRQFPIEPFVVDFICESAKLIIEVDGETHVGRAADDEHRTRFFESLGYRVVRFTNDEVLKSLVAVAEQIGREAGLNW
jgi:very-short-patch-repair endonuclease